MERPNEALKDILLRNDTAYIDLLPDMFSVSQKNKDRLYFDTDPHWTRDGHEVAVGTIVRSYKNKVSESQ